MGKKIAAVLLSGILAAAAVGCGSSSKEADNTAPKVEKEEAFVYTNAQPMALWKNVEDMPYYDDDVTGQAVTLTPYVADGGNGGCLIICPGGGYGNVVTEKEGTAPAKALNENGISAFVLNYRVAPYDYHAMLTDIFRAIRYVRYHAEDFGIDPDKIGVMGFSAGGHLAAMSLEHFEEDTQDGDEIDAVSAKPDCGVLCYPVLSMQDEYTHQGSREKFLGDKKDDEEYIQKYSAELGVTQDTPPCFVWHCDTDSTVPYQGSQAFADAMSQADVPCEFHLYHWGGHGLGLATDNKAEVKDWFPTCIEWLRGLGF